MYTFKRLTSGHNAFILRENEYHPTFNKLKTTKSGQNQKHQKHLRLKLSNIISDL